MLVGSSFIVVCKDLVLLFEKVNNLERHLYFVSGVSLMTNNLQFFSTIYVNKEVLTFLVTHRYTQSVTLFSLQ